MPPAWVATIGPKGYETDFGYLTRTHPPLMREAIDYAVREAAARRAPSSP